MEANKTVTPWEAKRVEQAGNGEWLWCVYDETGMVVAKRLSQAKAERIVRACNAHDDFVKAATSVLSQREGELPIKGWLKDNDTSRQALAELAAALTKAQEA